MRISEVIWHARRRADCKRLAAAANWCAEHCRRPLQNGLSIIILIVVGEQEKMEKEKKKSNVDDMGDEDDENDSGWL